MTDAPDLEELARRYLDLWQAQLSHAISDPEVAESLRQMFGLMAAAAAPMGGFWSPGGFAQEGSDRNGERATVGATPPGPAPDHGGEQLADIARRLANIEKRLDALESRPGGDGRKPAAKPRKRKP